MISQSRILEHQLEEDRNAIPTGGIGEARNPSARARENKIEVERVGVRHSCGVKMRHTGCASRKNGVLCFCRLYNSRLTKPLEHHRDGRDNC